MVFKRGSVIQQKPFNTAILLAKIASLLKAGLRKRAKGDIDLARGRAEPGERRDYFTESGAETDEARSKILYYLFRHAGTICPRNDIVDFLWDNQLYVDDNALSVNITRIREKLSAIGLKDFIRTKHRQGYTI